VGCTQEQKNEAKDGEQEQTEAAEEEMEGTGRTEHGLF
jgi:hypothetical protein